MALMLGAVTVTCAGAYFFGEWALIVFPIVLGNTAIVVLASNDRFGAVRTRDLQRRDGRSLRVLAYFLGGLVLLVCLGLAIQAVLGT